MTSINPIYTISYEQPEEYRFSHDSVFLAQFVSEHFGSQLTETTKVLDLCSGCGIIGLDLLFHFQKIKNKWPQIVDFVEVQTIYEKYFSSNSETLSKTLQLNIPLNFINLNYGDLCRFPEYQKKYDLIVCNPPYFKPEQGRLSPSEFKNRCRFYIDSNFQELIKSIEHSLSENGSAYVLINSLHDHKLDFLAEVPDSHLKFELLGSIRKTNLYRLYRS